METLNRIGGSSVALCLLLAWTTRLVADGPISPEEHLGRPVGTDFKLADWKTVAAYVDRLAAESPRVRVEKVGKSTEGRDVRIVIISSAANLERLDELKGYAWRLADPRGLGPEEREEALQKARVFFFISCNIHSTEIASPEMSLELAYRLASSDDEPWKSARRELVVVVIPSVNPDGMDRVVEWYRKIRDTAYESASLPELYQHYAGHDNNRDWFLHSLAETRNITRLLYLEWFPQIYWDVHQQGSTREWLFVPPFRDPLNPNLDPALMAGIGTLGSRMLLDLTREGLTGVATGVTYDMWWNGGNRNVPVRHNMIGLLTEAASTSLASPIFLKPQDLRGPRGIETGYRPSNRFPSPWPGGWWRLGDIVRYELAAARSLLGSLARERRHWLELTTEAAERAVARGEKEPPFAWLVPSDSPDHGAVRRLVESLLLGGVEIHAAAEEFTADERPYPAGTLVIRHAQPYSAYVKDLFELQRYPGELSPYDVTGWTLPLLLGVRRLEVVEPFSVQLERVRSPAAALARFSRGDPGEYYWHHLDGDDSDSLRAVARLLQEGVKLYYDDGRRYGTRPGAWVLPEDDETLARARQILEPLGLTPIPAAAPAAAAGSREGTRRRKPPLSDRGRFIAIPRLPRVGLYAPWVSSMDEGWCRWVFDHFQFPYTRVRNETIRAGNLNALLDVLVIPSISANLLRNGRSEGSVFARYAGGLDPEGSVAIQEFVRNGGTLIAVERSADYAVEIFSLELENAAAGGEGEKRFQCPGAILRTLPERGTPWTAGLPDSQPIFFSNSRAFQPRQSKEEDKSSGAAPAGETLLRFPEKEILLSGWIQKADAIASRAAWLRFKIGKGQLHLFGFRPHYRSWSQTTFRLLFRAILLPSGS